MSLAALPRYRPLVVAALVAALVAIAGGVLTRLDGWYYGLAKPAWQPPEWLFGPAWTTIFALTAVAAADAWRRQRDRDARIRLLLMFGVNAVLNVMWSALFFHLRRPDWALMEVGFLWLSVLWLVIALRRVSTTAAWMLAPYLAWVAFAAVLNFAIVKLNAPFGGA